jgi:hypothetical protein
MAGKAKSCYLTVAPKDAPLKSVLSRVFFNAKDLNDFVKTDEFKAKYPPELYQIIKETY